MASVVGICNQAIARTGNSATIAALTEASVAARQCNAHWEQVRDEVLQAFPWGCSTKRVDLSLIDEELVTNWQYCYSYPSDALRIFALVSPANRNPSLEDSIPFEIATHSGLKVILSGLEADTTALEECLDAVAAPLRAALPAVTDADCAFGFDHSFALTREPFIVFTSNIFAILGLRSLYFMLGGAVEKFHLLKYGLATVLVFVGLKMVWLDHWFGGKFPIGISLVFIGVVLGASIVLSLMFPKAEGDEQTEL